MKPHGGRDRDHQLPLPDGPGGLFILVYHGQVSADSDGPVEFCKPVPADQAAAFAAALPALTLRTEPAHQEAYIQPGHAQLTAPQWELLTQSLGDWVAA